MFSVIHYIGFSRSQIAKFSDMFSDAGQVFLASVVLPSIGWGGHVNTWGICSGILITTILFAIALRLVRNVPASL